MRESRKVFIVWWYVKYIDRSSEEGGHKRKGWSGKTSQKKWDLSKSFREG